MLCGIHAELTTLMRCTLDVFECIYIVVKRSNRCLFAEPAPTTQRKT